MQNPVMPRRKKMSPDSSRRLVSPKSNEGGSVAKTEEMRKLIHSFRGKFKLKPGEKSVVQELIEERRDEREKENRREAKSKSTG